MSISPSAKPALILRARSTAIADAKRAGAGVTAAILAGERAANVAGAQDVRTLFSLNGGRTLQPFVTRLIDAGCRSAAGLRRGAALQLLGGGIRRALGHAACRRVAKANELLRLALAAIKAGTHCRAMLRS